MILRARYFIRYFPRSCEIQLERSVLIIGHPLDARDDKSREARVSLLNEAADAAFFSSSIK